MKFTNINGSYVGPFPDDNAVNEFRVRCGIVELGLPSSLIWDLTLPSEYIDQYIPGDGDAAPS